MDTQEVISIKNLKFSYQDDGRYEIDEINLSVQKGEFIVMLGPSGAGKSTLIKCLNGLIPHNVSGAYEGSVSVQGKELCTERICDMSSSIGIVFQNYETQLFNTEVQEDILFGPENYKVSKEDMSKILKETLSYLNMDRYAEWKIEHLSGGQKQKIAIGSIIALNPGILVMDEPTTDLDPVSKESIYDLSRLIQKLDKMHTLIIAENDTENAIKADKIVIIEKGKIVRFDHARKVLTDVALFRKMGLQTLQIPEFFYSLGIESKEIPLTPTEGAEQFRRLGLKIKQETYEEIRSSERQQSGQIKQEIIRLDHVSFQYQSATSAVVEDIHLSIYEQEFIAIIGQNGCGKTTLSKLLNGILKPTEGQVWIEGEETGNVLMKTLSKKIAYVFQNPDQQIFSNTVYDEIAFGLRNQNVDEETIQVKIADVLKILHLSGKGEEDPFSLTKGERQKIAVASALVMSPKIILLDEPTTGLDYREQRELLDLLRQLNRQGHTIIMITHSMWAVSEYANRVLVMNKGRMLLDDVPRNIFDKEEELLNRFYLKVPHIVKMSNLLGSTMLSVGEFLSCIDQKGNNVSLPEI